MSSINLRTTDLAQLRAVRRLVQKGSTRLVGNNSESVGIPPVMRPLLGEIARLLESGNTVSVLAANHELSTQRAAELLAVSRPFFVGLLNQGALSFHWAGTHRRVYLADLLQYKEKRDRQRHTALRKLARADVEAGIYDRIILPPDAQDE